MKKSILKLSLTALPLLLTSCINSYYDTENCYGQYTLTPITPIESGFGEHVELKDTKTTILFPGGIAKLTEIGSSKVLELYKVAHTVVSVKGDIDKVNIDRTIVSVATDNEGSLFDAGEFVGGYRNLDIPTITPEWLVINYEVPTLIQTRVLTLKVKIEGDNTSFIESLSGVIKGVTVSRDLNNAFANNSNTTHPALSASSVNYPLNQIDNEGFMTSNRRLIGIDGNVSQQLVLTLNYKEGLSKPYTFDLTQKLKGFHNQDITSPWVIEFVLHIGADFNVSIDDWKFGSEKWMDAH